MAKTTPTLKINPQIVKMVLVWVERDELSSDHHRWWQWWSEEKPKRLCHGISKSRGVGLLFFIDLGSSFLYWYVFFFVLHLPSSLWSWPSSFFIVDLFNSSLWISFFIFNLYNSRLMFLDFMVFFCGTRVLRLDFHIDFHRNRVFDTWVAIVNSTLRDSRC